tara:strand:- start:4107 stop:5243 length:1137 start_codon:yes stop_codon:yes gene_type:complete
MTINSTVRKTNLFVGNGNASTFPFTFKVFTVAEIVVVKVTTATSTETTLTLQTDYTVLLNPDQNSNPGGSVTLVSGGVAQNLATGFNLIITSDVQPTQGTDLTNQGGFFPEVINDALDKAVILHQQQQEVLDRSIRFALTNTIGSLEITEDANARANKILGFDSQGEFQVAQELGVNKGDWVAATSYNIRDIVRDASNYNVYICKTAHTSSGSTPLKTNADIGNWDLLIDGEQAGIAANTATAQATIATNQATASANSASAALTSENNASGHRSAASASQIDAGLHAGTAQTNANTATTKAAEALQSANDAQAYAAQAAAAGGGGAVKISPTDTTTGFMTQKFVEGIDIVFTLKNQGANETLEVSAPYGVAYAIALGG